MSEHPPPTVATAAEEILRSIDERLLPQLPVVLVSFYHGAPTRRAITRAVTTSRTAHVPAALGADSGPLIVQVVVVALNAVAAGVAVNLLTEQASRVGRWAYRRRLARRPAPRGATTPLPQLSARDAAAVGEAVRRMVGHRADAETAQLVATALTAALTSHLPELLNQAEPPAGPE
ncbi:hypothetical protein AB0K00_51840 [Dactylosporangium sp. NPDC049525]|uniref:hypothetical protein n=1 Tax=Dactylosporangium sp. NPDC049525 TaxID=3154730 RepID=UPI0034497EDC